MSVRKTTEFQCARKETYMLFEVQDRRHDRRCSQEMSEDVVTTVNDILKKCDTRVEYIGFK